MVFALTPWRGRSGGPFKVVGGGGLSGVCCQWLSWEHARHLLRRPGVSGIIPGLPPASCQSFWFHMGVFVYLEDLLDFRVLL